MNVKLVGNTHLVSGGREAVAEILSLMKREGMATRANPDLYVQTYKQFGIDDARELRERAQLRPMGERRVFIIVTPDMNRESQNALLKTLEEPPSNSLFFFVVNSPETLLATFRSRAQMLNLRAKTVLGLVDAKKFLSSVPQKRLDMLKLLLEKDADDKRDQGAILAFLSSLEIELSKAPEGLRPLYRARKYITDRGALVKPLLEQLALLAPRM